MPVVRVLDDSLINQIAAGEVVERPANVVKELIENSMDAGATQITVEVEDGGKARIRVIDNGCGMKRDDASLAIRRHATSKIRTFGDLVSIQTLGFRGEALPSIASVSRFTLTTRTEDALAGVRVEIEGGKEPKVSEVGCPRGTTIDVQDLFFNVPARRKFLKARQTEMSHIQDVCLRAAVAAPALRMTLVHNGRRVRALQGGGTLRERGGELFDETLKEIDATREGVRVHAVLGSPADARQGTRALYLVVNGRAVTDRTFARHVSFGYGQALPKGKYPIGIVHVEVAPEQVDVNAHPQKTEVRFAPKVLDQVTKIIASQFGTTGPGKRDEGFWESRLQGRPREVPLPPAKEQVAREDDHWGIGASLKGTSSTPPIEERAPDPTPDARDYRAPRSAPAHTRDAPERYAPRAMPPKPQTQALVGEVRGLWIVEHEGELCVVDPVALAQRDAYLALVAGYEEGVMPRQKRVFPDRVELSEEEAKTLTESADDLASLGLIVTMVGDATVAVHEVPRAVADVESKTQIAAALLALKQDDFDEGAKHAFRHLARALLEPATHQGTLSLASVSGLPRVVRHAVALEALGLKS